MGLLVGTTFYPVISPSKRHRTIMWGFRLAAIPLAVILFVVLTRNFYTSDPYAGAFAMCVWVKNGTDLSPSGQLARDADICRVSQQAPTTIVKGESSVFLHGV
jgi:hypothetical protein